MSRSGNDDAARKRNRLTVLRSVGEEVEARHEKNGVDASKPVGPEHHTKFVHEGLRLVRLLSFASSDGLSHLGCKRNDVSSASSSGLVQGGSEAKTYLELARTEQTQGGRLGKQQQRTTILLPSRRGLARWRERSRRGL